MFVEDGVFARLLGGVVATDDFIDDQRIEAAGGQVHQGGDVVAEFLQLLDGLAGRVLVDGLDSAGAFLYADHLAGQIGLGLDGGLGSDDDDLTVFQVRRGEGDLFLARFGNGQAIPQHVDTLAAQFGFLGVPVDRLELDFGAKALGGLTGEVDVETDQRTLFIAEAHRREIVVEADDNFGNRSGSRRGRGSGRRFFLLAASAQSQGENKGQQGKGLFHGRFIRKNLSWAREL